MGIGSPNVHSITYMTYALGFFSTAVSEILR
mgnify:FL=1|jgi:hypothetical protein